MLTPHEKNLLPNLLQRSFAGDCVDFAKIRALAPREVECKLTGYKAKVVEIVFDPFQIGQVNARFKADGYVFDDDMKVIAVTEDGSILLWGGLNSVYHVKRGEIIAGAFDEKHLAFQDLLDFTQPFKIKRKKVEVDEMLEKLIETYSGK